MNFPSFSILGRIVEWGIKSIYPGPMLIYTTTPLPPQTGLETGKSKDLLKQQDEISCYKPSLNITFNESVKRSDETSTKESIESDESDFQNQTGWTFNNFFVSCNNHIALLDLKLPSGYVDETSSPQFDSPAMYKEIVIPQSWREIMEKSKENKKSQGNDDENDDIDGDNDDDDVQIAEETDKDKTITDTCTNFQTLDINEIMNKQFIKSNVHFSMNERLAKLEDLKEAVSINTKVLLLKKYFKKLNLICN